MTNPLFLAGVVIVAGFVGTRYWQPGSSLGYFFIQLAGFVIVTGLLLAGGVVPYRPGVVGSERMRLLVSGLEIIWWLGAAWLTVGFLRAFVVLGRQPRESKLVQDILAGLVYLAATFAIIAYVFGLNISSSISNVRTVWGIILDDSLQGRVIETNWRATRILTVNQDVAIIPNRSSPNPSW